MRKLIAQVDMDGTLVKYAETMIDMLNLLRSPLEDEVTSIDNPPVWLDRRMNVIKSVPGFWRNLEELPLGFAILDLLKKHEFKLNVLTKGPFVTTPAWTEKVDWCRKHLPGVNVTVTEDKSLSYGKVLVDDYPPYIKGWLEHRPRSIVLMPAQPWNEKFTHPQVIRVENTPESLANVDSVLKNIVEQNNLGDQ